MRCFPIALALAALAVPSLAETAEPAPTDFSQCESHYAAIGLPRMKTDGTEFGPIALCRKGYAVAFNYETRTPDWVIEHLPEAWLTGKAKRTKFTTDTDANAALKDSSATNKDYTGTNFDRGHQAPAADFKSSQPMTDQSFLFTNMAPQVGVGFNRNIWKDLETDVRSWIACGGRKELYVVTGPVYAEDSDKWIPKGNPRVRVPDAYFKVIYDPAQKRALGMLLPNKKLDAADLPGYTVPIAEIEKQTGIVFFPALTKRQQNLLKKSRGALWGSDSSCSKDVGE
jgi:endonuclease G, mitochondrial